MEQGAGTGLPHRGQHRPGGDAAPDAWRRPVAWMIQSFRTPARGPLPDPPEDAALYQAMRRTSMGSTSPGTEKGH
ncbi:hypothetical protein OHB00_22640 [Streptomyces sp. NBC_00631]|uniref:hypothetical protein n=1 Tax=Streptomyces sp. NBC_00631 TaxID=2975793 RepID=UPI0030E594D0